MDLHAEVCFLMRPRDQQELELSVSFANRCMARSAHDIQGGLARPQWIPRAHQHIMSGTEIQVWEFSMRFARTVSEAGILHITYLVDLGLNVETNNP